MAVSLIGIRNEYATDTLAGIKSENIKIVSATDYSESFEDQFLPVGYYKNESIPIPTQPIVIDDKYEEMTSYAPEFGKQGLLYRYDPKVIHNRKISVNYKNNRKPLICCRHGVDNRR